MKSKHQSLINALSIMATSPDEWRPAAVTGAREAILAQEREIEALHAQLASYRAVAAVSPEEMHLWDSQPDMLMLVGYRKVPQMSGEFKTLYVKD